MLFLPQHLPAASQLSTSVYALNQWQNVSSAMRVGLLNLMPQKATTELDIARTLGALDTDIQLLPIKIKGQTYKTTPMEHMLSCYVDFEEVEATSAIDRLIVTGAPLEQIPFEDVRYWPQLCHIMNWAAKHAGRTLYICWGAQAALYHFYGIDKVSLPHKCFGIFRQEVKQPASPLMQGLVPSFQMPNSRHTTINSSAVAKAATRGLSILAESNESGLGILASQDSRSAFVLGHFEYEPHTLDNEYHRDLSRHLPIQAPVHYYAADGTIDYSWSNAAHTFYSNWIGQ